MGKRKAAKPPPKKKAEPLGTVFKCLFCNHEKAVSVKLDKATMFGHLNCKICGQRFTTPINNLAVAVDVYCDWVDACEEVRAKQPPKQRAPRGPSPRAHGQAGGASFDPDGGPHPEDEERDAEGEVDEYDGDEAAAPSRKVRRVQEDYDNDNDEDEDEDEDDGGAAQERRREKRRRARDYDDDDEDEDD
ncbi:hypothetical protein I317_01939 [Kwoniella heveanensis CBS 569]|uniref:Transcription elongation factor 1 homolog n=1 Tax=Kwoniella heveanensis BCC8398 TaxID=1296120 RepID=A0A1B9GZL1_9TREE|nr:hypothetical protein I316_01698 [Kwoniella heveanensis BCC8398]OCF44147.1 hypothetical protein I317_01939 [Kwoniella heveanensis CBS 569]